MSLDLDEIKFCGLANTIAIDEFAASFDWEHGDGDSEKPIETRQSLQKTLYSEYVESSRPGDPREWLRPRIALLFECVGPRPQWIEKSPMWPFLDGTPMTFICQMAVPNNAVSQRKVSPGSVIYVFGARVAISDSEGWTMTYRVVDQLLEFAEIEKRIYG